ncbi:transposase [Romeria aff. gracilis LEGE 07310]|uniref:Transposase n=1 Tax=Vasconcelosia minhoensis LEGE 07310 TaxID=915328 RepID=A0A8J7DDH2_9CYAN|nr:transposase [Romeria aff. gracilis LEGE 07310]
MISVVDVEQAFGYALSVQQTPPRPKASPQAAARVDELSRVDDYLRHLRVTRPALPAAVRYMVGNGYYSKVKWVDGVIELGLEVIGKLRCNANLLYFYSGPQKPRSRRRIYDDKVNFNFNDLSRWSTLGDVEPGISLYSAVVWSVNLKRPIRVVYLLNHTHPQCQYRALLFSSDPFLEPLKLYQAYRASFQIEFIFRDAKQFTGLADAQTRSAQKLDFHFNASLTALNLAKWDDYKHHHDDSLFVFSMASYRRRKLNQHMLERFIVNLD